ncbi:TPA: cellulose biosynthesis protein BcsQ [Raoultella planticola]
MAILGLQGIRGGVGTTSITAALAWALQLLGETVLAIDASPDNMLRYFFNVDATHRDGWARALIDGGDWRDAGIRYTSHIDILPFGLLSPGERENVDKLYPLLESFVGMVEKLEQQGDHRWLLLDLPEGYSPLTRSLLSACDRTLVVVHPDGNSHIRLHQQALPAKGDILINDLRVGSQLQEDLYQLWLESQRRILPVTVHRDEAMAECLAAKQPLGEYRSDSLAAEEILTLANWCLLHYSGKETQ